MKECMWLVKNGIGIDLALRLDRRTRAAYCIIFSEFEGKKFDFDNMRFEDDK